MKGGKREGNESDGRKKSGRERGETVSYLLKKRDARERRREKRGTRRSSEGEKRRRGETQGERK